MLKTSENIDALEQLSQRLCFSGQGKGRISADQNRTVFQYEAQLDQEKNQWKLAMNFPMHPEERLDFYWRQHPETDRVEGRFKGRIIRQWQMQGEQKKEQISFRRSWPEFQRLMALFFSMMEQPEKYCQVKSQGWVCRDPSYTESSFWEIEFGEKFIARALVDEEIQLTFESFSTNDNKHDRLKIDLSPRVFSPQTRSLLTLELFAQSCELQATAK